MPRYARHPLVNFVLFLLFALLWLSCDDQTTGTDGQSNVDAGSITVDTDMDAATDTDTDTDTDSDTDTDTDTDSDTDTDTDTDSDTDTDTDTDSDTDTDTDTDSDTDTDTDTDTNTDTDSDTDTESDSDSDVNSDTDSNPVTLSPCPTDGSACKIMPFGDSITDGYNWDTPGGYRLELFRQTIEAGQNITFVGSGANAPVEPVEEHVFPPNHEGHSGWTIDQCGGRQGISSLVDTVMPTYTPHIVLLMIGTNDAIDSCDMDEAPTRLGNLIDSIYSQLPDILIVVAQLIPSRGDESQGDDMSLSGRIETYNAAIPAVVQSRADLGKKILIVDMYTPFAPDKANLMMDEWHPNLAGYELIGAKWYEVLAPYL